MKNISSHLRIAFSAFLFMNAQGVITHAQAIDHVERNWINDTIITDSSIGVKLPHTVQSWEVEVCASMKGLKDKRGKNKQNWSVEFLNRDSVSEVITISWGNNDMGNIDDYRYLEITGSNFAKKFSKDVSLYSNDNYLVISSAGSGKATVSIGNQSPQYAGEITLNSNPDSFRIKSSGTLDIGYISTFCEIPLSLESGLTVHEITESAVPKQGTPAGIWTQLDRENDPDYARPGGNYTLAVVPNPLNAGDYLIIYLDGAVVNESSWKPGLIKGRLEQTPFEGLYNLKWYTAHMCDGGTECNATLEEGVLSFNFPLLNARLRFRHR